VTTNTAAGTINPAALSFTGTRTYDSTTTFAAATFGTTGTVTGVAGETLVLTGNGAVPSQNVNANTQTVNTAGLSIGDGTGLGANYTFSGGTQTGTITTASLQVNAVTDSKTYDATTASSAAPAMVGTLFGTDTVTGKVQVFGSKNVLGANGSTLSVTAFTVNDGAGGTNYSVTNATATGTITAAALQVNAVTDTKTYDSLTTSSAAPAVVGLLGTDTVTGKVQAFGSKDALGSNGSTL
jgi:hypothetical protein